MCKEALVWNLSRHRNILPLLGVIATQGTSNTPGPIVLITPWMNRGSLKVYLSNNPGVDKKKMVRVSVKEISVVSNAIIDQRCIKRGILSSPPQNSTSCPR